MTVIKAVVFDIGSVLETIEDKETWLGRWPERVGLSRQDFDAAIARVDPEGHGPIGKLSEVDQRAQYVAELGLSAEQADQFYGEMWEWYCGELDTELVAFARSLRPRFKTGILSNAGDGARREEQRRWGFEQLVDDIVYSHEVGLVKPDPRIYQLTWERLGVEPAEVVFLDDVPENIAAAQALGIHAIHHVTTEDSIRQVQALL